MAENPMAVREARIILIMKMMRALTFEKGKTARELAVEWDMPESSARKLTAEASKRVRAEIADPEEVERDVGVALSENLRKAHKEGNYRAVADLTRVWASISVSKPPQRTENTIDKTGPTPARAAALVAEIFGDKAANGKSAEPDPQEEPDDGSSETGDPPIQ